MYINKNFSYKRIFRFSGKHLIWLSIWIVSIACLFQFAKIEWLALPWVPVSVIGTAVAFYIGFKNNQAYDRLWEARKIWGAIVNSSRAWGSSVNAYVSNQFAEKKVSQKELEAIRTRLVYRHVAWLYMLRSQLLIPTPWEHVSQNGKVGRVNLRRQKLFGLGFESVEQMKEFLQQHLPHREYDQLIRAKNTATQILHQQALDLAQLRERGLIDDFRHMELQKILNEFYVHQGKCERIKKFPLPRQYGSMSSIFVGIFIFLLPFSLIPEFQKMGEFGIWASIPIATLISWVYLMMELVGDYSENPFEGLGNDIPMMSLCRVIEIDLKEMLGETELPPAIQAKNGILM